MKGFIVYPSYVNVDEKTFIQLFGRLENGESFVCMNEFKPYLFVKESDLRRVKNIAKDYECEFEKGTLKNFSRELVARVSVNNQTELNSLKEDLHDAEINTYEGDLKPHFRYMIDKNLKGSIEIDGDYENSERVDRVYRDAEIVPGDLKPKLKIASIDLESGKVDGDLYCIGIYSENYEKCFVISDKKLKNAVNCKDEADCLEKFKEALIELDPDIITGWNVIDFDFLFLKNLFDKYKIGFDLGRANGKSKLRIEKDFFRSSKMDVSGRIVIDGLNFIRDPFIQEAPSIKSKNFESFTLESVSEVLLGETKLIKGKI